MPAYIIVEVDIKDPVKYEEYKKLTPTSLEPYGGKFIVRGGKAELIEGKKKPNRIVVIEFENSEKAKAWWNSPLYNEAKKIRHATSEARMLLVEGV
jgi:uncharacterized protein (DUF1330 family)